MNDLPEFPFPESRTAQVDGVHYHYRNLAPEEGVAFKGNVLLIHGFASSTFSWRKLFAPLSAKGYRVIAVDIPPFGFSERSPWIDNSPVANAERLWKILDQEGIDKCYVAGHSMGARVAGSMGALRSDRCKKVFLIDGPFFGTGKQRAVERFAAKLVDRSPLPWLLERLGRRMAKSRWITRKALTFIYGEKPSERAVKGYMRPLSIRGTGYSLPSYFLERSSLGLELEDLTCKVHLIWGEKDRLFKPRMAERFLDAYPYKAECSLIKGGAHCSMETHPKAFLTAMLNGMSK